MGAVIGGLVSGIGSLVGGKKRQRNEQNALRLGFDFARESPLGTQFLPSGGAANESLAGILGVGGDPDAQSAAINNFLSTPGFEFIKNRALEGVTSSAAAGGKLNSGATLKALQDRAGQVAATQLPTFMNALSGLAGQGLSAGQTITGAGSSIANANAGAVREGQDRRLQGIGTIAGTVGNIFDNKDFNPFGLGG